MKTPNGKSVLHLLCLLPALASVLAGPTGFTEDPLYDGKPLSAWVDELPPKLPKVTQTHRPAVKAVRAIGTNAIPWLLRELTTTPWTGSDNPTNTQSSYLHQSRARAGFWALGEIGTPAIPSLVELIEQQPDCVPAALAGIGAYGLPALELCLTNVSAEMRPEGAHAHSVVSALGGLFVAIDTDRILTNQAAYLLPTIRFWTQSTNRTAAYWANGVLGKLSPDPRTHE